MGGKPFEKGLPSISPFNTFWGGREKSEIKGSQKEIIIDRG
jgi:hypothetical protein